ncbi:MAG: SAM-dependent methyltransferase [Coriobacteriia bacterium]|nr:SAM-dependent methyltransferase [Coriobacteriia bacterium]MCL2870489.1 SAM-dependent methyltransferase [Coriobacteriia bacterium]
MEENYPSLQVLNTQELNTLIGLTNPQGEPYKGRLHKYQQLADYYVTVRSIVRKLSTKRTLYLYDCGSGRSYLSFYLNYRLQQDGFKNVSFICIDSNEGLVERSQQTAASLNIDNMMFYAANIADFEFPQQPDIIYSLHACDTATDQMIHKGIVEGARHILSVSCCQHTARKQMKGHPLAMVARHQPYKERLTDMLSDSLRALILEAYDYKVTAYEFVPAAHTPKNIMLRCARIPQGGKRAKAAMAEYQQLSELFNMQPALMAYLEE